MAGSLLVFFSVCSQMTGQLLYNGLLWSLTELLPASHLAVSWLSAVGYQLLTVEAWFQCLTSLCGIFICDIHHVCQLHEQTNQHQSQQIIFSDVSLTVHHSLDLFHLPTLMHNSFVL